MIPYLRLILKVIVLKLFLLICFVDLANLAYKLYEIYKFFSIMNVHKHFINILRAPPSFYSTLFCIPRNISTFGKTGRYKSAVERCLSKIGWKMRACKNFILSTSHIRRNWVPCLQRTTFLQRRRTGLGPSSCRHSSAIGLEASPSDSGGRSGRHTFKKFYFKKTIIDNISRQKKHTFSINQGYKMIILRPLLQFSRFEFLKFCEFWYLPIIPDFTNFNVCFRRNNLRLQFIPYLKIFLNLNLFQKIDQFQQILKLENQYLQFILKKIHGGTFYGETAGQALGPFGAPSGQKRQGPFGAPSGQKRQGPFDFAPEDLRPRGPKQRQGLRLRRSQSAPLTSPQIAFGPEGRSWAAWLGADKSGSTLWGEGH